MASLTDKVEEAIVEAVRIREAIDDMARIKDKVLLAKFGITESDEDTSSSDDDLCLHDSSFTMEFDTLPSECLKELLEQSNFNWFEVYDELENSFPT